MERNAPTTSLSNRSARHGTLASIAAGVAVVALILAVAGVLIPAANVLLLVFAGLLFAVFLANLTCWISRHTSLPYRLVFCALVLILAIGMMGGAYSIGTQFVEQASELTDEVQSAGRELIGRIEQSAWMTDGAWRHELLQRSLDWLGGMQSAVQYVLWWMGALLAIFFIGLFAAYDPDLYRTGVEKLFPPRHRPRAREVVGTLRIAITQWIVGRLISMTLVGVATAIGLWWLGVPLPVTLGVLAALLTFIPNLGPLLATIPQALLAFQVDTTTALYVVLFNIVLQTIESNLITPIVQRCEVTLPPVLTLSAQLLMGAILGIVGVMMAAPLMVVIMVLVQMLYVEDCLDEEHPGELVEQTE